MRRLRSRERDAGPLIGVEHEYELYRNGTKLDMRSLIGSMELDGVRADPADPLAVQCSVGGVITADGAEAEVATPPIPSRAGAIESILDHVAALENVVDKALGSDVDRVGYSTHISVEVPDRRAHAIAHRLAREWSPSLTMMTQHPTSPGLLVRPRWNRVEFGCEHLEAKQLAQAIAFCVGATAAAQRRHTRPSTPELRLQPSRQRFGWFVDRSECAHRGLLGRTNLSHAWSIARPYVVHLLDQPAATLVDAVVAGHEPLPVEAGRANDVRGPSCAVEYLPYDYRSGELVVTPHQLTWRLAVFRITTNSCVRWLQVPGTGVRQFLRSLHSGALDSALLQARTRIAFS